MNSVFRGLEWLQSCRREGAGSELQGEAGSEGLWVFAALMSSSLQGLLTELLQDRESEPARGPELIQRLSSSKLCTVYC